MSDELPEHSQQSSPARKRKRKHRHAVDGREAELLAAARGGDATLTASLLAAGVKASARDENHCTCLHWASLFGHEEVLALLLDAPSAARLPSKRTKGSRATPLHYAVQCGHSRCAAALLAAGADAHVADITGSTPCSLGLDALVKDVEREARLDALQAARDAAAASAFSSAAWESAQRSGAGAAAWLPSESPLLPSAVRAQACAQWEAFQLAWPVFEARAVAGAEVPCSEVPWPFFATQSGGSRRLLLAMMAMPAKALREAVRSERLRWHPDRWGRLWAGIAAADRPQVEEAAGAVIRALNALADATAEKRSVGGST